MKALKFSLLALLIVLTASPVLAQQTAAPAAGNTPWGAGIALFDGDYFGVGGRRTFELGGDISTITTGATIFFKDTWFAFDADYHFVINPENPSRFYPLVGLELATDFDFAELGANLGGGVDFMLTGTRGAYFELKYVVSDLDGFNATLGVRF